jgi:hypothetical protein
MVLADFSCSGDPCVFLTNPKHDNQLSPIKKPARAGFFDDQIKSKNYLILASLYMTCLRTTGSNFLISIFSGMVRLFLSVV